MIEIKREIVQAAGLKPVSFSFTVSSLEDLKALYTVFDTAYMTLDDATEESQRAETMAQALLDSVSKAAADQGVDL